MPSEDDITKKIGEVGNVSMPLDSSLIRGCFVGVRALSLENSRYCELFFQNKNPGNKVWYLRVAILIQDFDIFALDYDDSDGHFLIPIILGNKYDLHIKNYPLTAGFVQD
jgi:cell surface protein SprA